jgi:uncharacterized membrane protein YkvA (DUF1232 family)
MLKVFQSILEQIQHHILTLFYLTKNPKPPWYCKVIALFTVYYFLSPIDLIPDFIPILGQLDDILIVPFGVWVTYKFAPNELLEIARTEAANSKIKLSSKSLFGILIVAFWILVLVLVLKFGFKLIR